MKRRWLIRSFFIGLLVLCVGAWVGSHFEDIIVQHDKPPQRLSVELEGGFIVQITKQPQRLSVELEGGEINLGSVRSPFFNGPEWTLLHYPVKMRTLKSSYQFAHHRLLGFGYDSFTGLFDGWGLWIPLWLPTLLSAGLCWFVCRRTRPKVVGRAFPVEPTNKSGEVKS